MIDHTFTPKFLPENTHPYGVKVLLELGENVEFVLVEEQVRAAFGKGYTLRIQMEPTSNRESANFITRISVHLEAFASESEAERIGNYLIFSLLWLAVSKRIAMAFEWKGNSPYEVYKRQSSSLSLRAHMRVFGKLTQADFFSIVDDAFTTVTKDIEPHVLTSMEFYASARFESSNQARFIGFMTALEALAKQEDYDNEISELVDELTHTLKNSTVLGNGQPNAHLKESLVGRLKRLKQESVRQAIIRLIKQYEEQIKEPDVVKLVDKAYGVRSSLLHEGVKGPDMNDLTNRIEDILRQVYSAKFSLGLIRPIDSDLV